MPSNYPPGVHDSDFADPRDWEYREYVAECRADGDIPLPRRIWEIEREREEAEAQEEDESQMDLFGGDQCQ